MIEARSRILWYLDLQNSSNVQDLFKIKRLETSKLDEEHYFLLLMDLTKTTEQCRSELMKLDKERYVTLASREDPTVDLLCSTMESIGSRTQP